MAARSADCPMTSRIGRRVPWRSQEVGVQRLYIPYLDSTQRRCSLVGQCSPVEQQPQAIIPDPD